MFHLIDTFNHRVISSHKTFEAADNAMNKHSRDVRRTNGQNSYIPKTIVEGTIDKDGDVVTSWGAYYEMGSGRVEGNLYADTANLQEADYA